MTAWSTTNKAASIALSGSNLIATKTGNSDATGIADTGYSSGKRVFSIVMNVVSDAAPALSRVASGLTTYPGDNATSLSVIPGTGIYYNGVTTTPAPTVANGNTVFIAVDFTNSRLWWRVGTGGQWNGSGTANPDTNVGGYNMSALQASGALYPAAGFFSSGGQQTLDPTAAGHGLSTFTPWDAASGDATAAGVTLTAPASLITGAASGVRNETAAGQTLTATASLIPGAATGVRNATASGVTYSLNASLVAGTASGGGAATAVGQTIVVTATLIPGGAMGGGGVKPMPGQGAGKKPKASARDDVERIYAKKRKDREEAEIAVVMPVASLPEAPNETIIRNEADVELLLLLSA